jgi:superfamily II DNA helicase RecQ
VQSVAACDGRLIVATNAFALGIDAPDVRVVIHAGDIYQMRSYSQESGRGGRDGERSKAIVVMPAGKQEELRKKIARARARTTTVEGPESRDAAVGGQAGGAGEDGEVFERQ